MQRDGTFGNGLNGIHRDCDWTNPQNDSIKCSLSARRQAQCMEEEFLPFLNEKHVPTMYFQDVMPSCFVLRVTMLKQHDFVKREWYDRQLKMVFGDNRRGHRGDRSQEQEITEIIAREQYPEMLVATPRNAPYPLLRETTSPPSNAEVANDNRVNGMESINGNESEQKNDNKMESHWVSEYVSPLLYTAPSALDNADYTATMRQFVRKLNRNHGEHHLEAYCLTACLVNYPPIIIPEDLHVSDYELLQRDIDNEDEENEKEDRDTRKGMLYSW